MKPDFDQYHNPPYVMGVKMEYFPKETSNIMKNLKINELQEEKSHSVECLGCTRQTERNEAGIEFYEDMEAEQCLHSAFGVNLFYLQYVFCKSLLCSAIHDTQI